MTDAKVPYKPNQNSTSITQPPQEQITPRPDALAIYADRTQVRELAERLTQMLPNVKQLGNAGALALAQVSISMGLNPFVGEIWAIPQKGGTFSLMTGIKGLRRAARHQAAADDGMYTVAFRHVTEDEAAGLRINPGDIIRACDLWQDGRKARAFAEFTGNIPKFTGIGVYRQGEKTMMNPLHVARKRAEADALKQAYDLPIGLQPQVDEFTHDDTYPMPAEPATRGRKKLYNDPGNQNAPASAARLKVVQPPVHWIAPVEIRRAWWAWCKNELNLSSQQVHRLLDVESMYNYPGTHAQARCELQVALMEKHPGAVEDVPPPPQDLQEDEQCPQ